MPSKNYAFVHSTLHKDHAKFKNCNTSQSKQLQLYLALLHLICIMDDTSLNRIEESSEEDDTESKGAASQRSTEPMFKFRNYTPQTRFLDGLYTVEKSQQGSIRHLIEDKLNIISDDTSIDPKLLEPKKVDWDLKRRLEKRMEILDRDTRKSISKHVKEVRNKRRR